MKEFDPRKDLQKMIDRYLNGSANTEEKRFVESYYKSFEKRPDILEEYSEEERKELADRIDSNLMDFINRKGKVVQLRSNPWLRAALAASVLIIFVLGLTYYLQQEKLQAVPNLVIQKDFLPGVNKAQLITSDGKMILLDSVSTGRIKNGDMAIINKSKDGFLVYEHLDSENQTTQTPKTNTVTTPAGGQYQVVLADGSKVWLNASSSIKFPTFFSGNERKVQITGECYFEIAKDLSKSFVVNVAGKQDVIVTGTHFNVNSYLDEVDIKTTLLEGAVIVKPLASQISQNESPATTLKPGEEFSLKSNGKFLVKKVNVEEAVAWKNGLFQFQNTSLPIVMRQIARWYNVEVAYENAIPAKTFSGKIHRGANASQILQILSFTGVNFRLEESVKPGTNGRIIVVN